MIKRVFDDKIDWQARENRLFNKELLAGEHGNIEHNIYVEVTITDVPFRGFAALLPETIAEIGRKGNKGLRALGKVHCFTTEEGKKYGAMGGRKSGVVRKNKPYKGLCKSCRKVTLVVNGQCANASICQTGKDGPDHYP